MRASALLFAVPLLLQGCNGCNDQQIIGEGPVASDGELDDADVGSWLSMDVMPDGKPAIAYYDRDSDALGFAIGTVSGSDVSWAKEKVDSYADDAGLDPGDAGKYASLVVSPDGVAWVSYQDSNNGTLKYAKRDAAGSWTVGIADVGGGVSSDAGYWSSIALDASKNPVIAHYDNGQGTLRLARWSGSSFSGGVVYTGEDYVPTDTAAETEDGDAGEYAKILVTGDGTEYIAFYDRAWGALRLASGGASGFSFEIVDDSADVGQWPDLVEDGGTVSIAYHDVTNQDLKLAQGTPGSWTLQTLDDADYAGADPAIYVSSGEVSVLYFDGVNNDMKLARRQSDAWVSEAVTGTGAAVGYHNETVESGGVRYAACYDYTNRGIWFSALP